MLDSRTRTIWVNLTPRILVACKYIYIYYVVGLVWPPFKPWPNGLAIQVNAIQREFAKPELAYGPAKGGQTDSQVGSLVANSRKFHAYHCLMRFYNNSLLAINLCRLALGGQTVTTCVYWRPNLSATKVSRNSMQVDASGWPNETQV